jgi:hypothetical protein
MSAIKNYSRPKNDCCLVDIDGTFFFDGYFDPAIISLLNSIDLLKIVVTARSDRSAAEKIVNESGIDYYSIYCNHKSIDPVNFKIKAMRDISVLFNIKFALDDDTKIINAYREAGVEAVPPEEFKLQEL